MDLRMRAVLLVLLLNQVAARPRLEEDMENNLLLHSLELATPPAPRQEFCQLAVLAIHTAQIADYYLDKKQMLSMRKRGGLLQPQWIIRLINQDPKMTWNKKVRQKIYLEKMLASILKFMRNTQSRKQPETGQVFVRPISATTFSRG